MRILAIFGSDHGQAETVAHRIAATLERLGHEVTIERGDRLPRDFTLDGHEGVLVIGSVHVGRYHGYLRKFVARHAARLGRMPSAFVSISGALPESDLAWRAAAMAYVQRFLASTGWTPSRTAVFAGALRYPRYDVLTRFIMKQLSRRIGAPTDTSREFEFTDWAAVDRFAAELGAAWSGAPQAADGGAA